MVSRERLTSGGTAAWASSSDVEKAAMFRVKRGLLLGRMPGDSASLMNAVKGLFDPRVESEDACKEFLNRKREGRLVWLHQAVHTVCFAPVGAGKSTGLVIPFLKTCPDSTVVIDFKGELARATMADRRAMGHTVVLLDPYKVVTDKPDTFDPIDFIDPASPTALDDCRDGGEALVVRTGEEKDPHWNDKAESVIAALLAAVVYCGKKELGTRSLQTISDILSNPKTVEAVKVSMQKCGGLLARWAGQLENLKGDEKSSVMSTVDRHLRFLTTPSIAASTSSSSFDPAMLKKGNMTIYAILPPDRMRAQAGILRMWMGSFFRAVIQCGLDETKKVFFELDECAALGSMRQLDDAIDKYRGYGIRLNLNFQSLGQLKTSFPVDQGQTLLSNCSKIFMGCNDIQTAEFVSKSLGNETILVQGWSSNSGWGTNRGTTSGHGYSESSGTNESGGTSSDLRQQSKELLRPEQVLCLDQRLAILLTPGLRPLITRVVRYFEEPNVFTAPSWWNRVKSACRVFIASAVLLMIVAALAVFLTLVVKFAIEDQPQFHPVYQQRR